MGDSIRIKTDCNYEVLLRVYSKRGENIIVNDFLGDTIFKGKVSKYRGLYYFSQQINDTSYRIFAVKFNDSLIYGLRNYLEYFEIEKAVKAGGYSSLVKYYDKRNNVMRLHPNKKEMKKLYSSFIDSIKPNEIVRQKEKITETKDDISENKIEPDDYEVVKDVFPNPVKDFLTLETQPECVKAQFILTDLNGKILLHGTLINGTNKISINNFASGMYLLSVTSDNNQKEIIKIMKVK